MKKNIMNLKVFIENLGGPSAGNDYIEKTIKA